MSKTERTSKWRKLLAGQPSANGHVAEPPVMLPPRAPGEPPPPPAEVPGMARGLVLQFYVKEEGIERGSSFNFWGMPIEDALTNAIDLVTRLNQLHQMVLSVGLPGTPMSLKELDEMYVAKVQALREMQAEQTDLEREG